MKFQKTVCNFLDNLWNRRNVNWQIVVSPFSVTPETVSNVDVVIDQRLLESSKKIAVHPSDIAVTAFITADQLKAYLEGAGATIVPVEFTLANM